MSQKQKNIVYIKRLSGGVNYRISYDYIPQLNEYIKSFIPREHWKVHVENTVIDGKSKDIWSRDVREFSVGKVISFLVDNNIPFQFVNMTEGEINILREEYRVRQNRLRQILREKVDGLDVSDMDFSFMKIQPYNYQKQASRFFEMNDGNAVLADEMGVGKSMSVITYATRNKLKTLVVCPSSLKLNWRNEVDKFSNETTYIYKYKPSKKSKIKNGIKEESLFHVINYESLETFFKFEYKHKCSSPKCKFEIIDLETKYAKCPRCQVPNSIKSRVQDIQFFQDKDGDVLDPESYDLIVLDECHYIKNEKAQRTKLIRKVFKDVKKKILVSGTPIKNRPYEFFPILNFLKPEEFNNSHEFAKKYCAGYEDKFGWNYDGASNLEELYERISPFFLRRLKSDVSELPPKTYVNIPIELTDKQLKDYATIEKGCIDELTGENNSGEKKTALTILLGLRRYVSEIKIKEVIPIIQNFIDQDEKVVVFSEFQNGAEKIKEAFGDKAVMVHGGVKIEDRNQAVENFQKADSEVMVFAGTIGAAGVGLTLTRASNLIFIGKDYSNSMNLQSEDRVHRITTTASKVTIYSLICQNTIDEDIEELLYEKSVVVSKAVDNKVVKREYQKSDSINSGSENNDSIIKRLVQKMLEKTN